MINLIWAQDANGNIGKDNQMPWRLPADLAYFKKQTTGKTIVMGRKTYDSLGKALPNRENIVLTRDPELTLADASVVHTKADILKRAETEDIFIIGGAQIYALFADDADRLYVTKIAATFDADTAFPVLDWQAFRLVQELPGHIDEKNKYPHAFFVYEREQEIQ